MVADVVRRDRTRAFGLIYWAINIGFALACFVAGRVGTHSFSALFIGNAVATLAFGIIVLAGVRETHVPSEAGTSVTNILTPFRDLPFLRFALVSFVVACLSTRSARASGGHVAARRLDRDVALISLNGVLVVLPPFASPVTHRWRTARILHTSSHRTRLEIDGSPEPVTPTSGRRRFAVW